MARKGRKAPRGRDWRGDPGQGMFERARRIVEEEYNRSSVKDATRRAVDKMVESMLEGEECE